jgi:hypothetical protein
MRGTVHAPCMRTRPETRSDTSGKRRERNLIRKVRSRDSWRRRYPNTLARSRTAARIALPTGVSRFRSACPGADRGTWCVDSSVGKREGRCLLRGGRQKMPPWRPWRVKTRSATWNLPSSSRRARRAGPRFAGGRRARSRRHLADERDPAGCFIERTGRRDRVRLVPLGENRHRRHLRGRARGSLRRNVVSQ